MLEPIGFPPPGGQAVHALGSPGMSSGGHVVDQLVQGQYSNLWRYAHSLEDEPGIVVGFELLLRATTSRLQRMVLQMVADLVRKHGDGRPFGAGAVIEGLHDISVVDDVPSRATADRDRIRNVGRLDDEI